MIALQGGSRIGCQCLTSWEIPDDDYFESFYHPEYCIGQTVLHKMRASGGEILHPVIVHGVWWTGIDWEYNVLLPADHPEWVEEDNESRQLAEWLIEPI